MTVAESKVPLYLEALVPAGAAWVAAQERRILRDGIGLTGEQQADARAVGVGSPERIRILVVDAVPTPGGPLLSQAASRLGIAPAGAAGMAMRYGIFVMRPYAADRRLLVHEMAHTVQYERFGGIRQFLRAYVQDVLTHGYTGAALEAEANAAAWRIVGQY